MASKPLSIDEVNNLSYEQFVSVFGSLFEQSPLIAAGVWSHRPFKSRESLYSALCNIVDTLPRAGKEGLLRCYPDLAGQLAHQGTLTPESTAEHRTAGLLELTTAEQNELDSLNEAYKQKFGFPFVICARENKVAAIIAGLKSRQNHGAEEEVTEAIGQSRPQTQFTGVVAPCTSCSEQHRTGSGAKTTFRV
ncbi:hypothetical protein EMCRGX_G034292 [Ephydatia muelleri]